eukprot:CAMPEP_0115161356 /NCGR_PEP_ID=MMETSP0227-20121206/71296_1 /TAXON_ID=89957 /ORGANISM="Polarella glacialis, Strain CCMP 1383" /LENGTH=189 /DNA_ID=CAMNT_0002573317 /DNA_START=106 /DNA_END=672 /DNA_ORIENTATION=-
MPLFKLNVEAAERYYAGQVVSFSFTSPLDVEGAERFLNSLAVRAEEWAIGSLLGLGVAPQETSQQQSRTVVGGWRNRSDLDRLVPGLIRKGLIGGRIEMLTRETCTYVCSIRPLQRAVVAAEPQATARDGAAETAEVSLSSRAFGKLEGLWQTSEPQATAREGAAETAEVSLSSRAFGKLEGLWQTSEP